MGSIHDGHRERLKQKYLRGGLDILADHEVLELLLFYAVKQGNVNPLAHRLIKEFGSLRALFEADAETIAQAGKVSINTAILITLALPLARRYETVKWGKKHSLSNSQESCEFAKDLFIGETDEVFYMICLDASNQIISSVELARGTIDKAPIYPRVLVEKALQHSAATVILAHNHPTGKLFPSQSDLRATNTIRDILEKIEVNVADHIIVGGKEALSFAEKKLLNFL
ncbi:MAG: DNA repair protein RadC [Defluviitaleaceae bacterium]|nr:DNA repair protein RadC [Defluviitaleaceae bacterium]MCL2836469.1 DNA repair protein RadC [Defluviitaleaceae bacterium]